MPAAFRNKRGKRYWSCIGKSNKKWTVSSHSKIKTNSRHVFAQYRSDNFFITRYEKDGVLYEWGIRGTSDPAAAGPHAHCDRDAYGRRRPGVR
jgi:hypothetical protein